MRNILDFFLRAQCITEEILCQWYVSGDEYNFVGYNEAKEYAKAFIETLVSKQQQTSDHN